MEVPTWIASMEVSCAFGSPRDRLPKGVTGEGVRRDGVHICGAARMTAGSVASHRSRHVALFARWAH